MSPVTWSYYVSIIAAIILAVVFNSLVSERNFKEIGFFGTKFIKEDIRDLKEGPEGETFKEYQSYILSLEKNLQTIFDVSSYINDLVNGTNAIQKIEEDHSNFLTYFNKILQYYYKERNLNVEIDTNFYKSEDINDIIKKYESQYTKIKTKDIKNMKKVLMNECDSKYFELGNYNIFLISQLITFNESEDKQLLIKIKSLDEITVVDLYPIFNFIYTFTLFIK